MKQHRVELLLKGFKNKLYSCTVDGDVFCEEKVCGFVTRPRRIMKTKRTHKGTGYYLARFYINGNKLYYPVHQVIWTFFNGPIPEGMEINHKDCDKTNNAINNLELTNRKGNAMHAYKNGLMLKKRDKKTGRIVA